MKQFLQVWREGWKQLRLWLLERRQEAREEGTHRGLAFSISLLISFLLWFTASMQKSYTLTLELPLEVRQLPPDRAPVTLPPEHVRVQFEGEGWQLLQLYYRPPTLPIEVTSDRQETIDVLELVNNLELPPTIRAIQAIPRYLTLELAPRTSRRVPIRFRGILEPAPLYDFIEPPRLDPDSVTASGAVPIIRSLRYWPTEFIERRDIRNNMTLTVPLSDTLRGLVELDTTMTSVIIRVALFTEGRRQIPIRLVGVPPDVRIRLTPSTLDVIYRVPLEQYDAAQTSEDFYAVVHYADIQADTTGTVRPTLHLPDSLIIRDVQFSPRRIRYFLVITEGR